MIKLSSLLALSLICLCQCSPNNADIGKSEVTKISVVYKVPSLYTADSAFLAVDSSCIYYYNKYKVYELPLMKGHFTEGEFIVDSTTVSYVGYDTTKKVAFQVEQLQETPQKQITVDSFLRKRPTASTLPELLRNATFGTDLHLSKNVFSKRYALNYEGTDSLFLYFDNSLRNLPFSLSPALDADTKSKLTRIEVTLKADTSRNAAQFNQFRKISWDVSRSSDSKNFPTIIAFCKKIEALYKE